MSNAKLTLIGFYQYLQYHNKDLFSELSVPSGIDRQVLIDNILLRGGEFETLYSEPSFITQAIGVWSNKWSRTFTKWLSALNVEYNPLENYDRIEEWTDSNNGKSNMTGNMYDNNNTISQVSAFNSDQLRDDTKVYVDNNSHNNSESTMSNDAKHTGRLHGNIGVTTSQQMLQSELDIAMWNLYEHITDIFLSEFVIPIY